MSDFWFFAKRMLRYPTALVSGGVFAILAAAGLGIGIAALLPIMRLMLGGEASKSLVDLANDHNAAEPLVRIPEALIAQLPNDPLAGIALIIGSLCVLAIFGAGATFGHAYLSLVVATRTVTRIRQQAFHHVISMPLGRVVERGPSEFIARVVRDAAELQQGFLALTSKSVVQGTRGISCLVVALFVSWEITVVAPVVGVIFAQVLRKFGKRVRQGTRGSLQAQERLLRIATESVQGLRAVKANTAERQATWRFHNENRQVLKQELRARVARALASPISELLATFMVSGLAIVFASRILKGTIEFEQFVVALGALAAAGASFKPLAGFITEMQAAAAPAARLREIIAEPRENARGALRAHAATARHVDRVRQRALHVSERRSPGSRRRIAADRARRTRRDRRSERMWQDDARQLASAPDAPVVRACPHRRRGHRLGEPAQPASPDRCGDPGDGAVPQLDRREHRARCPGRDA